MTELVRMAQRVLTECSSVSPKDALIRCTVVLVAWVFVSLMLFAMNFMLDSFTNSRAASYTTLITSAITYFIVSLICFIATYVAACTTETFAAGRVAFTNLLAPRHLLQLFLLGLVDALGGFTGTYGAPNTPIAVQFVILATSVAWTFLFARWLIPDRDRPCTPFVFVSVLLTIVGAGVTIIPQWQTMEQLHGVLSSVGWILVYLLAALFPLFLNVLYSKYLVENVDHAGRSVLAAAGSETAITAIATAATTTAPVVGGNCLNNAVTTGATSPTSSRSMAEVVQPHSFQQRTVLPNGDAMPLGMDVGVQRISAAAENSVAAAPHTSSSSSSSSSHSNNGNQITTGEKSPLIRGTAVAGENGSCATAAASSNWPFFVSKLSIALFGDAFFQLLIIMALIPLDFTPWFGAATSAEQSFAWMRDGFKDVFANQRHNSTPLYFALYFVGFFASHIMGAALSYYSPQLCAFIYSVNTPLNLILLAVFPTWNVFGLVAPLWASLTSIVLTSVGALMYAAWDAMKRIDDQEAAAATAIAAAAVVADEAANDGSQQQQQQQHVY